MLWFDLLVNQHFQYIRWYCAFNKDFTWYMDSRTCQGCKSKGNCSTFVLHRWQLWNGVVGWLKRPAWWRKWDRALQAIKKLNESQSWPLQTIHTGVCISWTIDISSLCQGLRPLLPQNTPGRLTVVNRMKEKRSGSLGAVVLGVLEGSFVVQSCYRLGLYHS